MLNKNISIRNNLITVIPIRKYGLLLRLVESADAEFILELRNNINLKKHISEGATDIDTQIKWIENYKHREALGDEYYFIAEDANGNRKGTTRILNFQENTFELGSWVYNADSSSLVSILGEILSKEVGYTIFDYHYCNFSVRKDNKSVLRYHLQFAPKKVGEDDNNIYFELSRDNFYKNKKKFLKILGYEY